MSIYVHYRHAVGSAAILEDRWPHEVATIACHSAILGTRVQSGRLEQLRGGQGRLDRRHMHRLDDIFLQQSYSSSGKVGKGWMPVCVRIWFELHHWQYIIETWSIMFEGGSFEKVYGRGGCERSGECWKVSRRVRPKRFLGLCDSFSLSSSLSSLFLVLFFASLA